MSLDAPKITNIDRAELVAEAHPSGQTWRHVTLDAERLGVRVEELAPGEASSVHHWHTAEEEHLLVLAGVGTLLTGTGDDLAVTEVVAGDHVCFRAGVQVPHHLENRSDAALRYLVFGERNPHDVVVYPEHQVMLTKGWDMRTHSYRPFVRPSADDETTDA